MRLRSHLRGGTALELAVLVVVSLFAAVPLFQLYLFASDDGVNHIYRMYEFDRLLRAGIWYPRWAPDFLFGLGYPVFNYYAPLSYYLGSLVHLFGPGFVDTFKILSYLSLLASGLAAYLYARDVVPGPGAVAAAGLYMLVPYHLVDLYQRGALPELLAFVWFPLLLWLFGRLVLNPSRRLLAGGAMALAGLVLSHTLSVLLVAPPLALYVAILLWPQRDPRPKGLTSLLGRTPSGQSSFRLFTSLGAAVALGVALSAIYWLPVVLERDYVQLWRAVQFQFQKNFVPLSELISFSPLHLYAMGMPDEPFLANKIGLAQGLLAVLGVGALLCFWRSGRERLKWEGLFSIVLTLAAIYLLDPASTWLWQSLAPLAFVQFPWRLLLLIALPSSLLAGIFVESLSPHLRSGAAALVLLLGVVSSLYNLNVVKSGFEESYLSPLGLTTYESIFGSQGTTATGEFTPRWASQTPPSSPISIARFSGTPAHPVFPASQGLPPVQTLSEGPGQTHLVSNLSQPATIAFNIFFFPGWKATIDGVPVEPEPTPETGLLSLPLPAGEHQINLRLEATGAQTLATAISLVALLISVALLGTTFTRRGRASLGPRERDVPWAALAVLALGGILLWSGWSFYTIRTRPSEMVQTPLELNLNDELYIVGYTLWVDGRPSEPLIRARPGSALQVQLAWRPLANFVPDPDYYRLLVRFASRGTTWSMQEVPLTENSSSASQGVEKSSFIFRVPEGTAPNAYRLEMELLPPHERRGLPIRRFSAVPVLLSDWGFQTAPIVVSLPETPSGPATSGEELNRKAEVRYGGKLLLQSYELAAEDGDEPVSTRRTFAADEKATLAAGEDLVVNLLWQTLDQPLPNYLLSTRLYNSEGIAFQITDLPPVSGLFPSSYWQQAQPVRDQLRITVRRETPPGDYVLRLQVVAPDGTPLAIEGGTKTEFGLGLIGVSPTRKVSNLEDSPKGYTHAELAAEGLSLAGYVPPQPALHPGDRLNLDLLWHNQGPITGNLKVELALRDRDGGLWAQRAVRPGGDAYPTNRWLPGSVVRQLTALQVPASAPNTQLDVLVSILDPRGQPRATLNLGSLSVSERPRLFTAPPISNPLSVRYGESIELIGFEIEAADGRRLPSDATLDPGKDLRVRLFWHALERLDTALAVSLQLLDSQGRLVAQHDAQPQNNEAPTTTWLPGEIVPDEHPLTIPPTLPAGNYRLAVVLYHPPAGERLRASEGEDAVVLATMPVP